MCFSRSDYGHFRTHFQTIPLWLWPFPLQSSAVKYSNSCGKCFTFLNATAEPQHSTVTLMLLIWNFSSVFTNGFFYILYNDIFTLSSRIIKWFSTSHRWDSYLRSLNNGWVITNFENKIFHHPKTNRQFYTAFVYMKWLRNMPHSKMLINHWANPSELLILTTLDKIGIC